MFHDPFVQRRTASLVAGVSDERAGVGYGRAWFVADGVFIKLRRGRVAVNCFHRDAVGRKIQLVDGFQGGALGRIGLLRALQAVSRVEDCFCGSAKVVVEVIYSSPVVWLKSCSTVVPAIAEIILGHRLISDTGTYGRPERGSIRGKSPMR